MYLIHKADQIEANKTELLRLQNQARANTTQINFNEEFKLQDKSNDNFLLKDTFCLTP